jgi:hypothetical protein
MSGGFADTLWTHPVMTTDRRAGRPRRRLTLPDDALPRAAAIIAQCFAVILAAGRTRDQLVQWLHETLDEPRARVLWLLQHPGHLRWPEVTALREAFDAERTSQLPGFIRLRDDLDAVDFPLSAAGIYGVRQWAGLPQYQSALPSIVLVLRFATEWLARDTPGEAADPLRQAIAAELRDEDLVAHPVRMSALLIDPLRCEQRERHPVGGGSVTVVTPRTHLTQPDRPMWAVGSPTTGKYRG